MKRHIGWIGLAAVTVALSVLGKAQDSRSTTRPMYEEPDMDQAQVDRLQADRLQRDRERETASMIKSWPLNTKIAAQNLISKYGQPDGAADERLTWSDKGQWSQVTLFREGVTDNFPTTHENVVENTIQYAVPRDKAGELTKFNSALVIDRTAGTLSARSDSEMANILALNLADEIVRGKRTWTRLASSCATRSERPWPASHRDTRTISCFPSRCGGTRDGGSNRCDPSPRGSGRAVSSNPGPP